jgi:uncharacterized protein YyaL (SSP411 family)
MENGMSGGRNLLGQSTSPYLLQHAANPVHWRLWGRDALAEAAARDVPVLLSIGYAACHWCHVMAHESFEDSETAEQMNRDFVCIKVDREERPDVDHHYMSALHAMGEQGGWPLTMFLTPEGEPFYGGTYWPPRPGFGRPSFRQVLASVTNAWRNKREGVLQNAAAVTAHLRETAAPRGPGGLTPDHLSAASAALLTILDPENGGIGRAPKFPNAPIFRLFWSEYFRTGDVRYRDAVRGLLDALSAGGIYDHLGGGFARYSTDAQWHVPHFEKMLYDNAQILELLALAHADEPSPVYAARARDTFTWLQREMRTGGAFAASLDADQDGEEGLFYVWRAQEIDAALGAQGLPFKHAYDVREEGNWEGLNVLRLQKPVDPALEAEFSDAREKLFALREMRNPPGLDDKILCDWNGLLIAALARASAVFAAPEMLAAARAAFDTLDTSLRDSQGRLVHAYRNGVIGAAGMLDDSAAFARAALALFEATGEPRYLAAAEQETRAALARFGAEDGGLYLTAADAEDAPAVRARIGEDGATPSGVGLMAEALVRLYHLTDAAEWREAAERLIAAFSGDPRRLAQSPLLLSAYDFLTRGGCVAVEGAFGDPQTVALIDAARRAPDPALAVFPLDRSRWPGGPPGDRPAAPRLPAALLCRGQVCGLPERDPAALAASLRSPAGRSAKSP